VTSRRANQKASPHAYLNKPLRHFAEKVNIYSTKRAARVMRGKEALPQFENATKRLVALSSLLSLSSV